MDTVTRCPQCQTCFRVVPDQLRIAEGWVRCGRCGEVFEAALHALPTPSGIGGESIVVQSMALPSRPESAELPPAIGAVVRKEEPTQPQAPSSIIPDAGTVVPGSEPTLVADWDPLPLDMDINDDDPPPSFLQHRPRAKTWVHHLVWASVALLALLGLLLQGAYWERDTLAAYWPASRPALRALCGALACEVAAPYQLDAVVIESAAFVRTGENRFHLGFTVRNTAATEVARTHIELTMTDHADATVLRRVLTPQEMGATAAALAAQAEWTVSLGLRVEPGLPEIAVSGYRLEAFYP